MGVSWLDVGLVTKFDTVILSHTRIRNPIILRQYLKFRLFLYLTKGKSLSFKYQTSHLLDNVDLS